MKIDDGYIIYRTDKDKTQYFCGKPANRLNDRVGREWSRPSSRAHHIDGDKWAQIHTQATVFEQIDEKLVQTVRMLREDAGTDEIIVAYKTTELAETAFDQGDLYKERVSLALAKLDRDEIQLLGLGKIAMEHKLRSDK
jgi:hypothetical protein